MITLITMGAGNLDALTKTLDSFKFLCDEVVYGDLLLFGDDKERLYKEIAPKYNMVVTQPGFDHIFKNGFSSVLNILAGKASNDWVLYMNTSEVMDTDNVMSKSNEILEMVKTVGKDYNTLFFDHATDPHSWFRLYNRRELWWSGRIHEEVTGMSVRPYKKYPAFRMKDLEKDLHNPFKAWVFNDVKEIVYFEQYRRIVENPELLEGTNEYWLWHARENYASIVERLEAKGQRYEAFKLGDLNKYFSSLPEGIETPTQGFSTSRMVEFQGDKQTLL